ncbi:hypothetical protein C8Q74DRAFT_1305118 [Fomes fomentarius]|nr:hypothetical protein C8Q74DRAFT_1305118 [Fomes fomentarius]
MYQYQFRSPSLEQFAIIVVGLGSKDLNVQLFTVLPCAIPFVVTVAVAWFADTNEARSIATACFRIIVVHCRPTHSRRDTFRWWSPFRSHSRASLPP